MKKTSFYPLGRMAGAASALVGLGLAVVQLGQAPQAHAQPTLQRLHSFGVVDGAYPGAVLQGRDGALYGTSSGVLQAHNGTIFRLNTDGTGYTVLHDFGTNVPPNPALCQGTDGMLYGTTETGGAHDDGTVFKLNANGTGYTVLHSFYGPTAGGSPIAGVLQGTDGRLYGVTQNGGTGFNGTVFRLNPNGTGFTILYSIGGVGLVQGSDGWLYGTGANSAFKLNPNGTGFSVLHSFGISPGDGDTPEAALVQGSDGALYGTTQFGGASGNGTIFKLNTDGTGYTVLYSFTGIGGDGSNPDTGVVQGSDGALYGTAFYTYGWVSGNGTLFRLNTDGTVYTVLYNFTGSNGDGANPGQLVLGSDGAFYGTTAHGGDLGLGTIFRLGAVPPPLFTQLARLPDGNIQLTLSGVPYVFWRVQVATDLSPPSSWMDLTNVTPTNGVVQFSDLDATNSTSRFYRALWP